MFGFYVHFLLIMIIFPYKNLFFRNNNNISTSIEVNKPDLQKKPNKSYEKL